MVAAISGEYFLCIYRSLMHYECWDYILRGRDPALGSSYRPWSRRPENIIPTFIAFASTVPRIFC